MTLLVICFFYSSVIFAPTNFWSVVFGSAGEKKYFHVDLTPEQQNSSKEWWQACLKHFSQFKDFGTEYNSDLELLQRAINKEPFDYPAIWNAAGQLRILIKNHSKKIPG